MVVFDYLQPTFSNICKLATSLSSVTVWYRCEDDIINWTQVELLIFLKPFIKYDTQLLLFDVIKKFRKWYI